uniref:Uncharacterized protein n=1 Tax=Mustela putorius furo TaxID=9669 RepID=M3XNM8_MUSPF
ESPGVKLRTTGTSAWVRLLGALPIETARGTGLPPERHLPRPRAPLSASREGQLKHCSRDHLQPAAGTVPLSPPREPWSPSFRLLRRCPGSTGLPPPGPSAGPPAYLAGGHGRTAGSSRRAGAGLGPGARCRWWRRRRLWLLSLQLPLSPAPPPPPPPPAFPLGLLRCQERPNRGSASSRSLPEAWSEGPCREKSSCPRCSS